MRDDFSKETIERLAKRAGYVCAKPDCGIPTVGAAQGHDGVMNIGVAAHITAAAPGGPRFDSTLTSKQRRHHGNGIWLCQTHARLVDTDSVHFTVEMLREWKRGAETRSFRALVTARAIEAGPSMPGGAAPVDDIVGRLIDAARRDLAAFKRMPGWPRHPIALSLHMRDGAGRVFTTSGLAAALQAFGQIVIVAPPGTGKTTTMIQVSEGILALGHYVPVFVPLGEWSSQPEPLLQSVSHRPQYAEQERELIRVAGEGRLLLVLDGWNELDSTARKRASDHVKAFRRNFPDAGIVVSTRRQILDVPLSGPVVEIDALTQNQQREIACALRGAAGEALLDHAWRTPGIRELVAVPLYLTALLTHTDGGALPTTKDEVLRLFVTEHESVPEHAETLRAALLGFHAEMLRALAIEATRAAAAMLPESEARMVVGSTEERLLAERQLTQVLQPTTVLDVLVSHHILVRSGTAGSIAFQHQQFQEWYASFEAESLMCAAEGGNRDAQERLRTEILDAPAWEESILFACERLSRTDATGRHAVAVSILQAMAIDPMLAAEMIFRSSEPVWEEIRGQILNLADTWHRPGTVDRAVHFMISTGRPDFARHIWPLISSSDNQLYLGTLRAGRRFRPAVLGPDRENRVAALPEALRGQVLAEIAHSSGLDGIEFAAQLAQRDPSNMVQSHVLEALLFRRADRFVAALLRTAPDKVWQYLAERGYADEIADPLAAARVRQERKRLIESTTDLSRRLDLLVQDARRGDPDGEAVAALIERPDFAVKEQHGGATIYEAHRLFPEHVNRALLHRLCECQEIPFRTEELLRAAGLRIDGGPAVDRALNAAIEEPVVGAVAAVLGEHAIGRLMDALSALTSSTPPDQRDPAFGERYYRLIHWISSTPSTEFVRALLKRTSTSDPVEIAQCACPLG